MNGELEERGGGDDFYGVGPLTDERMRHLQWG